MDKYIYIIIGLFFVYFFVFMLLEELPFNKRRRRDTQRLSELRGLEYRVESKRKELQDLQDRDIEKLVNVKIEQRNKELKAKEDYLELELEKLRISKKQNEEEYTKQKENLKIIANENSQTYPWLANLYAEYFNIFDRQQVIHLYNKSRPAKKAAETVQQISQEKRELNTKCKLLEHQLAVYESLFPWLLDYKELTPAEAAEYAQISTSSENEYSALKNWLSPEEYKNLPSVQKYQLALDRYCTKKKNKWQIGIDYERFIGYQYEQLGYKVKYNGALQGLEDMGRDLIASKDDTILVVQCKRWGKEKIIHEKHIFQLYGSMTLAKRENPNKTIKGVFITTTNLSELAKDCAELLRIKIVENKPFEQYPLIKCNISKTGEKIYHLPFDQQYDNTMVNPKDGDFYAATIQEAENAGFRRAWRWHINS